MHAEIPQYLRTAAALDDLRVLLKYWVEVMHPIPEEEFRPGHPLWDEVLFVAYAIEDIGETLMTDEQRLSSLQREGLLNPALKSATA